MGPRIKRAAFALVAVATATVGMAYAGPVQAGPVPQPLSISLAGVNGVNRIQDPGRRCSDGGSGQYRHASIEAPLPPSPSGNISSTVLGGVLRGYFDVHHDGDEPVGTPLSGSAATAFLQGTESHVTMSNQRGSVQLRLSAGTCANPTLAFDGTTVSGSGTWTVDPGSTTGSYHPAAPTSTTGSGTFTLSLGVAPGADNPWSLTLNGSITVPQPSLKVEVIDTSWGNLGVDYATRRPTVTYRITNTGPGDTFNPVLTGVSTPTPGVSVLGFVPQSLPDLQSGQSTIVSQRFQLALLTGPCALIILNCQFDSTLSVSMPDVLDKADSPPPSVTVHARTPNLPPPLA